METNFVHYSIYTSSLCKRSSIESLFGGVQLIFLLFRIAARQGTSVDKKHG